MSDPMSERDAIAGAGAADLRRPGSRPQAGTEGRRMSDDGDPFGDERDDEAVSR